MGMACQLPLNILFPREIRHKGGLLWGVITGWGYDVLFAAAYCTDCAESYKIYKQQLDDSNKKIR